MIMEYFEICDRTYFHIIFHAVKFFVNGTWKNTMFALQFIYVVTYALKYIPAHNKSDS